MTPTKPDPTAQGTSEPAAARPPLGRKALTCIGCGAIALVLIIGTIVAATVWDERDGMKYQGKPLPRNVAYIGRWATDGVLGVRTATFAIAGNRLACDFVVRNASSQPVRVLAIGRTIIAPPIGTYLTLSEVPLELIEGDQPMRVTGADTVLGLQKAEGDMWVMVETESRGAVQQPEAFTLKPGEGRPLRFRPLADQTLMPASVLRLAVQLDDGEPPHPFYLLRKSAGIGGWFERGVTKAVTTAR